MLDIAIDISGTCTEVVGLVKPQRVVLAKVPTTPGSLVKGIRQGVARGLGIVGPAAAANVAAASNLFLRLDGS